MEINNQIREQVIADLMAGMVDDIGRPLIQIFINGAPSVLSPPDPSFPDEPCDIPAVAVFLTEGEPTDDDFDGETWSAMLTARIYLVADNDTDPALDRLGQKVIKTLGRDYRAGGLLTLCNRAGFNYGRDDEQAWGTLDLHFSIEYEEV